MNADVLHDRLSFMCVFPLISSWFSQCSHSTCHTICHGVLTTFCMTLPGNVGIIGGLWDMPPSAVQYMYQKYIE
jgi:hypothetical protein